uniref:Endonuclease/exonuclease/phosphatase domain-containing protein n=1 Tax=Latimeria chalumnae TaxID=7897 RepID=H3AUJ9_LATCH
TALIAKELDRYQIQIVALSEVWLPDKGQLVESGSDYTFFFQVKCFSDVGFAIIKDVLQCLASLPTGISNRILSLCLLLKCKRFTIFSVYAPTMAHNTKHQFYKDLCTTISKVPKYDKLVIMGYFNACVGKDLWSWPKALGPHGIGNCNSNGMLLFSFCSQHALTITYTFQLPECHCVLWMHPRSPHWHLIDYIHVRQKDAHDAKITCTMPDAISFSQSLVIQKLTQLAETLDAAVHGQALEFATINDNKSGKNKDWFSENNPVITAVLDTKANAYCLWLSNKTSANQAAYIRHKAEAQCHLRKIGLKEIYCSRSMGSAPLKSADGSNFITDKEGILNCWKEYYCELLNQESCITASALQCVVQLETKAELVALPEDDEIHKAVNQLTNDAIIIPFYKGKGEKSVISLLSVVGKILARILSNCLTVRISHVFPESTVILHSLHEGMMIRVSVDGDYTDPFPVGNGVRQACIADATTNCTHGVYIRFYIDGQLFNNALLDDEIEGRLNKASESFGCLHSQLWQNRNVLSSAKLVYQTIVTTLLYGAETWTTFRPHEKKLEAFHLSCLRKILCIHWSEHIPNFEVLTQALPGIQAILSERCMRWAGHIVHMHGD